MSESKDGFVSKRIRPLSLKALVDLRWRLFSKLDDAAKSDPALVGVRDQLRKLWLDAGEAKAADDLRQAERADKGVICWELFRPRTTTPLNCSVFDLAHQTVRTPSRSMDRNRYVTIKADWCLATEDPWRHLDREWHAKELDLVQFRRYAADIDEGYRREARRRNWRVVDNYGESFVVRCETADEAQRRVETRLYRTVVHVEEAELAEGGAE